LLQNRNPTFNESGVPTKKDNSSETVMSQGFTSLTAFSSDIKQWLIRSPQTKTPANIMYSSQTATFNPRSNLIYYLGGFFTSKNTSRNATGKADRVGFRTANVFDTKSGAWNTLNLRGQAPRDRVFTTATLSEYTKQGCF
jgi:hypothetical protein